MKLSKYLPAVTLFILIMTLSWYGRLVQKAIRDLLGLEGLLVFVCIACFVFVFIGSKLFVLRKGYIRALLILYPIGIYILRENPEEAVHLMEYGAFALSLSWLFAKTFSEKRTAIFSILGASILGVMDEGLQGINPTRVFDLRDILINIIGAAVTAALLRVRAESD
jgi:hypothetical protein